MDDYEKQLNANFDVLRWLDDEAYAYSPESEASDYVVMQCPACADTGKHLSVKYRGDAAVVFHCWRCENDLDGMKGTGLKLVARLREVSKPVARNILERYQLEDEFRAVRKQEERPRREWKTLLPEFAERIEAGKEPDLVKKWFRERRFPLDLCQKCGLHFCEMGEQALRLVIPVTLDGEVVSWTARDLTGKAECKYISCANDRGTLPIKSCLYGVDEARDKPFIILVEGVTDKWRLGDSAVALFGKAMSAAQRLLLWEKVGDADRPVIVCLDPDVNDEEVRQTINSVRNLFDDVRSFSLNPRWGKDPGDLTDEGAAEVLQTIRRACGGPVHGDIEEERAAYDAPSLRMTKQTA
jgi:hypothetical protein